MKNKIFWGWPKTLTGSVYYHHHVVPPARISLTLSRHFSLSLIASGRSSGLHPVSSHSCCMNVRAGLPAFARPYVDIYIYIYIVPEVFILIMVWYFHLKFGLKWSQIVGRNLLFLFPPYMLTLSQDQKCGISSKNRTHEQWSECLVHDYTCCLRTLYNKFCIC